MLRKGKREVSRTGTWRICFVLGLAFILSTCGGGRHPASYSEYPGLTSPAPQSGALGVLVGGKGTPEAGVIQGGNGKSVALADVLKELEDMPTPAKVDANIFARLKSALAHQLNTYSQSRRDPAEGRVNFSPAGRAWLKPSVLQDSTLRFAAKPPTGEKNRVDDLAISDIGGGTFTLTWSYKNVGDYNQDGIVSIQDITPLAEHFFETTSPSNQWIDGTGDGFINIADISPLAENFFTQCEGYRLMMNQTLDGLYSEVDTVSLPPGATSERKTLELTTGALTAGYWIYVVPFDNDGALGIESNKVRVPLPENQAPIADLTANPTSGDAPLTVNFDASGSYDPDGSIVQYRWDFEGDTVYDETTTIPTSSHEYTLPNSYDAVVEVMDDDDATNTATLTIVVTGEPPNQPPLAVLIADPTSGVAPLTVNFDASSSTDPDGTITAYEIDFGEGAGFQDFTPSQGVTQHTYNNGGTFDAVLRVTDDDGAIDTFTIPITVNAPVEPPTINSIFPLSGMEGSVVTFVANVSGTPPFTYNWNFGGGATPNEATDESPQVTLGSAGEYPTAFLEVTNPADTARLDFTLTVFPPGAEWSIYTIDDTRNAQYSSLAVVGGKPAIAYFDGNSQDLMYAYSSDVDGSGTWSIVTADSKGMGLGDVGMFASLAEINGGAGISYYEGGTDMNLKFAFNPNADGSGTWQTYLVDDAGDAGWITSLAEVQGKPAIGYFSESETLDYKYAINSESDGSGSWDVSSVANVGSGMFAEGRVLQVCAGMPAVAFYNWNTGELQFAINDSPLGTGSWTFSGVAPDIALFVSAGQIDSYPVITYRNFDMGGLYFAMNANSDGSGTWSISIVEPTISAWHSSAVEIVGYPFVAYRDNDSDSLKVAENDSPDGSGNWSISVVDSGSGPMYTALLSISGRPAIAYCNTTSGELKFAIRNF